jgi:hypothetical protein
LLIKQNKRSSQISQEKFEIEKQIEKKLLLLRLFGSLKIPEGVKKYPM